ncbi:50S ribosomal protein L29 [Acholeplasma oculi]|uniref:Large ribosomal subunit protein uL29 n=1 Tax=Acholeplasma oculi TaxID=35623 RepID=A0A061ADC7_9MOLU|nr:50S ribosomal protein L29 [Acholeplasma oculi]CDR31434.1 50S ribosomal protein L29 [Acholeplasma oculi]SKC39990.1 large subunit ribosomal protein L29 [Acholeplasma oculi]SUT92034.1 50S ribosomal protein L29 [Acholeplasma oculi]
MKAAEIRNLKTSEINNKIAELKAELFNLRFQHAVGQLENTARLKTVKKTIAQMKTIITERGE